MATKIRGRQIETGDFIRTNTASNVDWTNDTETASQAAIAAKIASSGVKEITSDYKVWQLSEGLYHVDGSANMNYGGGYFRPYTNYYLFVLNYSGYSDRKRFMLFYETNSNLTIYYGESTSTSGTLTQKNLSSLKNMGGASSGAAGSAGFAPAPAAGDNLKFLRGDATWQNIPNMVGATSAAAGSAGLVPTPAAGDEGKVLFGDGTWKNVGVFINALAIGRQPDGLYIYQMLDQSDNPVSYSEIVSKLLEGRLVIATYPLQPWWYPDLYYHASSQTYSYVFRRVTVKDGKLQIRHMRKVVENDTELWYEEIEYTTT
jgi:hypothetical protein